MILLMEEILHQLRLVVYPIIYRVLYIPGGCLGFLPSTVSPIFARSGHFGGVENSQAVQAHETLNRNRLPKRHDGSVTAVV